MERTFANQVVINNDFSLGRSTHLSGSISLTKDITLTSTNPDVRSAVTTVISGVISGAHGITFKDGPNPTGTVILSGANTYTGATVVSSGTLFVNGSLGDSAVTVNSGAIFGGSGTVGGSTTIEAGGHLAPGNSPGTITFADGLAFESGAIVDFELGAASDLILVTGGTLSGPDSGQIIFNLTNAGAFTEGTYTLLDWTGASLDGFSSSDIVLGSTISGYYYSIAQNGSTLLLTAVQVPEPAGTALFCIASLGMVFCRRRGSH
jgi:autotransporter-associated beta strand protein